MIGYFVALPATRTGVYKHTSSYLGSFGLYTPISPASLTEARLEYVTLCLSLLHLLYLTP